MPQLRLDVQQTQKLSQNMQTAIAMLNMDLDDLTAYMRKAMQENPALDAVPSQKSAQDYAMLVKTRFRGGSAEYKSPDIAAPVSTLENLEQQLRLNAPDKATLRVALRMLYTLSPRGYLMQDLDEFALEAGVTMDVAQRALHAVQALEPTGIGARTVEECLSLQLQEKQNVDPLCYDLIRIHLLDIGKGNFRQIAKATGATMARIQRCVDTIRSLTPTPCSLSTETVQYILPEFSVEADESGQLTIIFHNDYYPSFKQDENFARLSDKLQGEELAFARSMQASASKLIRAVEMRQSTMEKLARIIVREQRAFFLGQYNLLPFAISDAAKELGVHETTVYRALQSKYLFCSRGTFPLSHFFQKEVSGGVSTARVKEIILEICQENDKLSDRAIAEALEQRGITLSRRTVAKYRAQMNIDSSFRRNAEEKE